MSQYQFFIIILERDRTLSTNSFAQKRESLCLAAGFSSSVSQGPWQANHFNFKVFIFLPRVSGDFPPPFGDIPVTDSQPFMSGHTEALKAVCEKSLTANSLMLPSLKTPSRCWRPDEVTTQTLYAPIRILRMMEMEIQIHILNLVKFYFNFVAHSPSRSEDP